MQIRKEKFKYLYTLLGYFIVLKLVFLTISPKLLKYDCEPKYSYNIPKIKVSYASTKSS